MAILRRNVEKKSLQGCVRRTAAGAGVLGRARDYCSRDEVLMGAGASTASDNNYERRDPPASIVSQPRGDCSGPQGTYGHHKIVQEVYAAAEQEGLALVRSNNAAGYHGVRPCPSGSRMQFEAFHSPGPFLHHHLGYFATAEEAALAYARATCPGKGKAPPTSPSPKTSSAGDRKQEQQRQADDLAAVDLLAIMAKERSSPAQRVFQETVGSKYTAASSASPK